MLKLRLLLQWIAGGHAPTCIASRCRVRGCQALCNYAAMQLQALSSCPLHCDRVMTSSALRPPRSLLAFSSPKPRQLICTDGAALPPIATTASRSLCRTVVLSRKTLSSDLGARGGGCPSKVCLAINETRHRSRTRAKSRCQDETQTNGRIAQHTTAIITAIPHATRASASILAHDHQSSPSALASQTFRPGTPSHATLPP